MHHVLTLVCNPEQPILDDGLVEAAAAAVQGSDVITLHDGIAVDVIVDGPEAEAIARAHLKDQPIDMMVQPVSDRRKALLIADMDSTIITSECIDEIAAFVGIGDEIAYITERAMRGELDFEEALDERIALLANRNTPESALQQVFDEKIKLTPGARTLVQTMKHHGEMTALVSGGFTFFTSRVADAAGFQVNRANELLFEDGLLKAVARPILGKQAKLDALNELCADAGIEPEDALAVGDGANDLAMIQAAGLGVAFHAKPVVAEAARAQVNHSDLTALLYFQGYHINELIH